MLNDSMYSSKTCEWATPEDFYNKLNDEFHFNLDPCSTDANAKCARHFTKEDDGLSKQWGGKSILQPSIWKGNSQVGGKSVCGVSVGSLGCYAAPGQNGHIVVPRLDIWKGRD